MGCHVAGEEEGGDLQGGDGLSHGRRQGRCCRFDDRDEAAMAIGT